MASLNYSHDIVTDNFTVTENGITYEMNRSYYQRLTRWIGVQYRTYYTEESRGVFNWYRDDLLLQERKNIKVTGLEEEEEQ
ncbi:hypothetical protein V9K67_16935 [Paraflavisolibacter sp. H34]|uniref:hypothetical protein n=1 Tax=Huijunlia imazamoxiresistens TaxID=3127457 RepID=UPI0030170B80